MDLVAVWHVDSPGPGIEPVPPALAGRFSSTGPPGEPSDRPSKWLVCCVCAASSSPPLRASTYRCCSPAGSCLGSRRSPRSQGGGGGARPCVQRDGVSEEARCSPQPRADRGRGKSESLGPGTNGFIFLERAKSREAGEGRQLGQAELRRDGRRGRPGRCPRSRQARQRLSGSGPSSVRADEEQRGRGDAPDLRGHTKPGFMDERRQLGQLRVPLFCRHLRGGGQRALSTRPARPPTLDPGPSSPPRGRQPCRPLALCPGRPAAQSPGRGSGMRDRGPSGPGRRSPTAFEKSPPVVSLGRTAGPLEASVRDWTGNS